MEKLVGPLYTGSGLTASWMAQYEGFLTSWSQITFIHCEGVLGRRHGVAHEKLHVVQGSLEPGASVSTTALRYEVAFSLFFRWRRQVTQ